MSTVCFVFKSLKCNFHIITRNEGIEMTIYVVLMATIGGSETSGNHFVTDLNDTAIDH